MNGLEASVVEDRLEIVFELSKTKNAFGLEQAESLSSIRKKYRNVKTLVWQSGLNDIFCSGGDLKKYARTKNKNEGIKINQKIRHEIAKFSEWPVFKVAIVNGDCLGGGVEFLAAFDYVIASSKSCFGLWQRRNALTFGWGGFALLTSKMSQHSIQSLLLSTELISAWQAQRLGLVNEIFKSSELVEHSLKITRRAARWSQASLEGALQLNPKSEEKIFSSLWFSPAHRMILKGYKP